MCLLADVSFTGIMGSAHLTCHSLRDCSGCSGCDSITIRPHLRCTTLWLCRYVDRKMILMSVHPATLCLVAQKEGNDQSVENVSIVQKFPEGNEVFSPPSPPGGTWCPSRDHHCPQLIGLDQKSVECSTKKEMFSDCVANGGAGDGSHGNLNAAGRRNFL